MNRLGKVVAACAAVLCAFGAVAAEAEEITYNAYITATPDWTTILDPCPVAIDQVMPTACKTGGSSIGVHDGLVCFVERVGDSLFFQSQYADSYVKVTKVEMQVQNGRLMARGVMAKFKGVSDKLPGAGAKSIDDSSVGWGGTSVATASNKSGYGISSLTVRLGSPDCLWIAGSPDDFGVVTPDYGTTNGLAVGESFVCTASESWTRADRRVSATCKGWTVYTNNVVYMEGTGNSFTYVHPDCETGARLVWDWDATYVTTKCYVSTDEAATPTYPYDSWETAARDLNTALAVDVDEIEVGDGTYVNTNDVYKIDRAIKIYSSNGPQKTVLKAKAGCRQVLMSNEGAVLSGFTLTDGTGKNPSGNEVINMSAGTISNCVLNGTISFVYSSCCRLSGTAVMLDCELDMSGFSWATTDSTCAPLYLEGRSRAERCAVHGWQWGTGYYGNDYKSAVILASADAVLRNSLVYGNRNGALSNLDHRRANFNGGGVRLNNGTVENCTIVGNSSANNGGGIYAPNATGRIVNCIVWNNTAMGGFGADIYAPKLPAENITYLCASDVGNVSSISNGVGVGCTNFDPKLSDDAANLYALTADSVVCIDKGGETEASSAEGAIDLVGNPRLDWKNGIVDMGCYEFVPSHEVKPLSAVIDVKVPEGYGAKDITFTVIPVGDCTDGLSWCWHFGDGQTDTESLSLTHRYQPGDYTAYLSLTNELGEATNVVCGTRLVIVPQTVHVSKEGTRTYPYDTWEKATDDLSVALALQSPEVVVGDGTFTNTVYEHVINHTVNLHSLNGPQKTTLRRSAAFTGRHFTVGNNFLTAKTLISGFTLDGGYGGFNTYCFFSIGGGAISNCVIKGVIGNNYSDFCRISGSAKAFDCEFDASANASIWSHVDGSTGLLGISGDAVVERCVFHGFHSTSGNEASSGTRTAVNVNGANAVLRNSLVYDCSYSVTNPTTTNNVCGGGIRLENGTIANCTVVGCSCPAAYGGGIYAKNKTGKIVNCVVWGNTSGANLGNDIYAPLLNASNITYTCASDIGKVSAVPEAAVGEGCFAEDPLFRRPGKRDYRLRQHSPCLDAGDDSHYPDITAVRDLLGNPRKIYDHVDLGCYEMKLPGMLLIVR